MQVDKKAAREAAEQARAAIQRAARASEVAARAAKEAWDAEMSRKAKSA